MKWSSSLAPDDLIYTQFSLHSIPHRIRIRQVISELRRLALRHFTYADLGCGGGSITHRIAQAIGPSQTVGYDSNPDLIDYASRLFPNISFRPWDLAQNSAPQEQYDLVTCLETLEHVENHESALLNLLKITRRILLITVPIELGLLGGAKFGAKMVLGREALTAEHSGSRSAYFKAVLSGGDISRFRTGATAGQWRSHTGFDYRKIDRFLKSQAVNFAARNRGWNRFYQISNE
jgi:2-polyprenyl-3-methyl-5-hydroxy-6-metoxy-1,4-benzoquinol methylase